MTTVRPARVDNEWGEVEADAGERGGSFSRRAPQNRPECKIRTCRETKGHLK